jgi:type 1 glutamine amidotransferase
LTSAQAYALISNPTAISMMTGVFHFMATFLDLVIFARKVGARRIAVNQPTRSRRPPPCICRVGWLRLGCALLATSLAHRVSAETADARFTILVFSKTTGFRHDSIPQGIAAITTLGAAHRFAVDSTEDAARFGDERLARYKVVVFLNTTGNVLDAGEKASFERYIRSGGGFVGIHSASDTEYQWPWYGRLVGAYFASYPEIQPATIRIANPSHPSTKSLPLSWERTDEWYNFRSNPRGAAQVLATLDESTYSGGTMGADHPITWCHEIDHGRSWYTAMGHTADSYVEPLFLAHLLGGIESLAGVARGCGEDTS